MTPVLVLAVVLGAGEIPITDAARRFPDPSTWPGTGRQRIENMLSDVRESQGNQLATRGPGPQQIAARFRKGQLNAAERVAALLGSPIFHDASVLPMFAQAMRSPVLRERQAAVVGLAWLIGVPPPDPTLLEDGAEELWQRQQALVDALVVATREQPLIRVWVNSILAAKDSISTGAGFALRVDVGLSLSAIREIAQPEDVNELLALWPLLERVEQQLLLGTLEIITLQQFLVRPAAGPRTPTGSWIQDNARQQASAWVDRACAEIDGPSTVLARLRGEGERRAQSTRVVTDLLIALEHDHQPIWFVPSQMLVAFGAPAVQYDRQRPQNPGNSELRSRVRRDFGVSRAAAAPARGRGRDRRPPAARRNGE